MRTTPNPHPNAANTQRRNADRKRCPKCGRGAALVNDSEGRATFCRWVHYGKQCDYVRWWDDVPGGPAIDATLLPVFRLPDPVENHHPSGTLD
jgi:ribosomal protein S27AE